MREPDILTLDLTTPEELAALGSLVQARLGGRVRDFRLVVWDCGLVLRGRTRTYYAKQLALHAVLEVTRLPIRSNQITVK